MRPRLALLLGIGGAVLALVLLFPTGGGSTEIGIPPGGPDPNAAFVSNTLFRDELKGGHPDTDEETTTYDLIWERMATQAIVVALLPLLAGSIGFWLLRRSNLKDRN